MLRLTGIERIGRHRALIREQPETAAGYDDVGVLAFQTNRAVTVLDLDPVGQGDLETNIAAMAAALMPFIVSHHRISVVCD